MQFRKNILLYVLVPFTLLFVCVSFFRFMVMHDYVIGYEAQCDPQEHRCFVGCEDDECTATYDYAKAEKYAPDLMRECGEDVTDCDAANQCLAGDRNCSITYCEEGGEDECSSV